MRQCVILVHGFNVGDGGRDTVGTLVPFFVERGVVPIIVDYGHFGLLQTRFFNERVARKVYDAVMAANLHYDHVYVVGHSNGCAIADLAARLPAFKSAGFCYINPALKKYRLLPEGVAKLDVWHSPSDIPVKAARWLPFNGSWGEMGATGYRGKIDTRVTNYNKEHDFVMPSKSHSDVFDYDLRPYFGPLIVEALIEG